MKFDKPARELSGQEIIGTAIDARDGNADPKDIKLLIQQYCWKVETGQSFVDEQEFLLEAFNRYLSGGASLDKAFGLIRGKGAPAGRGKKRDVDIAVFVLYAVIEGVSVSCALRDAVVKFPAGDETVRNAWRDNKNEALLHISAEKGAEWSVSELECLRRIFPKERWISSLIAQT